MNEPSDRRSDPQSLRLRALMPSFTVDDLEHSLRFYEEGLGFTVQERWEEDGHLQGVMLMAGSCRLGLTRDDGARGRDRRKGVGFRVWASTVQDLDTLAERARQNGIEVEGPKTEPWGARTVTVVDPDGFKLTFGPPMEEEGT